MPALILMRPSALPWALAAGVIVLLYLRAIRPPHVVASRPNLWHQVLGEPRSSASAWFRRRAMSASIHVAIVMLLVLAATDPCLRRPRTVLFIVDNSRSMEAAEAGESRLAHARSLLKEYLETIGPREYAALVTTAGQPVVVSPAEQNLTRVAAAIERIRAADLPSCVAEAVDVARQLPAAGTRLEVHILSDGCFDRAAETDLGPDVTIHPVGSAAGNSAITRLAVRRYPNDARRFQVLVEVTNRCDAAATAPLHVTLKDQAIQQSDCRMDANSTTTTFVGLESETSGPLVATLDWNDPLVDDNRLEATLPDADSSKPFPESVLAEQAVCDTRSPAAWCVEPLPIEAYGVAPLWPWLVATALLLLTVEWTLYHRRWTC
jgi:hypothetical protein